jgi:hypothetical protein
LIIYIHFTGKIDLNQRIPEWKGEETHLSVGSYAMPHALCVLLNTEGEFNEEGCPFGFVVSDPNIAVVIGNDGIDDGQP